MATSTAMLLSTPSTSPAVCKQTERHTVLSDLYTVARPTCLHGNIIFAFNTLHHPSEPKCPKTDLNGAKSFCRSWKLTIPQQVNQFLTSYGTQMFNYHVHNSPPLSLSQVRWIQSTASHPLSLRSMLMLSSHLCLGPAHDLFPSLFPTKTLYVYIHFLPHTHYMPSPSYPSFYHHNNVQ